MKQPLKILALAVSGALLTAGIQDFIPIAPPRASGIGSLRAFAKQIRTADAAWESSGEQSGTEKGTDDLCPEDTARVIVKSMQEPAHCGGTLIASGYRNLYVLQYRSQEEADRAYQTYLNDPDICYAECDRILCAAAQESTESGEPSEICGTAEIGADAYCEWLQNTKTELPEIKVAVIDTGIYAEHAWLTGRILPDGANFCSGISADASDDNGHGTHVSGIIAAGTPDNVRLLPVKVLDRFAKGSLLSIYCGLMYALEQDADVINLSLGGYGESLLLEEAVTAIAEADIPLCTAAGNEHTDVKYVYPAYSEQVITVSAVDRQHCFAEFSNYGKAVDFAAPGTAIVSAGIASPTALAADDGTSMAAPFVTAAVADLLSYDPALTTKQIYDSLRSNSVDLGAPGFDEQYGWGEISLRDFQFTESFCRPPIFSPEGGRFRNSVSVTLTAESEDSYQTEIYYTTDGSEPNPQTSSRYTGSPFFLEHSAKIKAITVCGNAQSRTASADFCIGNEDVPEPFEVRDHVLTAYRGILQKPDLSELDGIVTGIGEGAFAGIEGLKSVKLPDSITAIGDSAFAGCSGLSDITGKNVTDIGSSAFSACSSLQAADFAPLTALGASAFRGCVSLSSLKNGLSESLTEIPSNAFRGCAALTDFTVSAVTEIGAYTFSGCRKTHFGNGKIWEKAEIIGEHAFESSGLNGSVCLPALRSIGSYAFAGNAIAEITLPDTLTILPEGVFKDNAKLGKITANGVTVLEAYAVQQTVPHPVLLELDPGKLTFLGTEALDGVRFTGEAVFSQLESVENGALNGIQGTGLYFPAVRTLGANAIRHAENAVMYFENLETVRTDAVRELRALIAGDRLTVPEPDSVSAEILAGSASSSLAQYAAQTHSTFLETPSLLTNQTKRKIHAGESVQLQALPLGFGNIHVVWEDEAGTVLQDDRTGILNLTLNTPGDITCRAVLYQDETAADTAVFQIHVRKNAAPLPTEIKPDEVQIADLRRAIGSNTAITTDGYSYNIRYVFRAEQDSTYRLFLSGSYDSIRLTDADGNAVSLEWDHESENPNAIFAAHRDCSYLIEVTMIYSPFMVHLPVCSVRLTSRSPAELSSLSDPSVTLQTPESAECIWHGEPVVPESIQLSCQNGSSLIALTENEDYIVYCTDHQEPGEAVCWIFGTGDYCGCLDFPYSVIGELHEDIPIPTGSAKPVSYFTFTPEADGDYLIFPDYDKTWIADQKAQKHYDGYEWSFTAAVQVIAEPDGITEPLARGLVNPAFSDEYTFPLKKGQTYRIILNQYKADSRASLTICPRRGVKRIEDVIFTLEDESNEIQLVSDSYEPTILNDSNLKEGEDYVVEYIGNDRAGSMGTIIYGIGRYTGTTFFSCYLIGKLEPSVSISVHIDESASSLRYQFIPESTGIYTFYTDYPEALLTDALQTGQYDPDSFAAETGISLSLKTEELSWLRHSSQSGSGRFPAIEYELTAGEIYYLETETAGMTDFTLYAEQGRRAVTEAEVHYQETITADELPDNPVTVTYRDEQLTEGTDYTVTLLNSGEDGQYLYRVKGIGAYCGTHYCPLTVTDTAGHTEIRAGIPFMQKKTAETYLLTLEEDAVVRLRSADSSDLPYDVTLCRSTAPDTVLHPDSDTQNITLDAGNYTVTLKQSPGTERTYVLEILNSFFPLSECSAEVRNVIGNGQPVHPDITLTYRNAKTGLLTILREGIDFRISGQSEWTEPGLHQISITGIGSFVGEKRIRFCILPAAPEALPLLTDGDYSAEITEPGSTVFYRWDPKQSVCIVSDSIRNRSFCFYGGTDLLSSYSGIGYQTFCPAVPDGTVCIAAVSFCTASETGTISFSVRSDYRELSGCQTAIQKAVPCRPEGSVPPFTVRDGAYLLQNGKDYEVFSVGGEQHIGLAEIILRGKGRYVGECRLDYTVYPESAGDIPIEEPASENQLTLRESAGYRLEMPGDTALFTFTAPKDGTYYLVNKPETAESVSVFIYRPDGSLNPVRRTEFSLADNETVRIYVVSNWLSTKPRTEGTLTVTDSATTYIWTDDDTGITYFVQGDSAVITDIETVLPGITLPDTIVRSSTAEIKTVTGIHPDVLRDCADRVTFYVTPDSALEQNLAGDPQFCYAYAFPETAVTGDVTGTGSIDRNDALTLLRILTECEGMMFSDTAAQAADCNGDGILDLLDTLAVLNSSNKQFS